MTATSLVEDFAAIVDIVSDVVFRPVFPEQQIELRRAEIITQLRQDEDNPAVRAVHEMFTLLYTEDHPYGRPAKGTIASIERIDRDALVRFHQGCFSPASLVVAAVGAIDSHAAIDRVTRAFGSFAGNGQPRFGEASGSAALSNVTAPASPRVRHPDDGEVAG